MASPSATVAAPASDGPAAAAMSFEPMARWRPANCSAPPSATANLPAAVFRCAPRGHRVTRRPHHRHSRPRRRGRAPQRPSAPGPDRPATLTASAGRPARHADRSQCPLGRLTRWSGSPTHQLRREIKHVSLQISKSIEVCLPELRGRHGASCRRRGPSPQQVDSQQASSS